MINNREKNNIAKKIYEDLIVKTKEEIIDICTSQTLVIYKLEKENKDLQDRINKAIEYIESYMPNYDFDKTNLRKLLEILKGSE